MTIDYGGGDVDVHDDQNLRAIFTHQCFSAGTFVVQTVLTDVAGQTATASCSYTWTAPVPAPVVSSTGGSGGWSSSGGGSTSGRCQLRRGRSRGR